MSPAFLASLTLGALVVWLLCDLGAYYGRLQFLARIDSFGHEFITPAQYYAARVSEDAREEQENIEIPLALAA